ncbi:MAG: GuaB3 family IMP dehydrogenase-related protein [Dehalococcoidia bacterium]|nr:GuaB3 family IMP dehydrogenase-related protein [Dehalococcoidia bacterium]
MRDFNYRGLKRAYGYDEVALVPGAITVNPDQTDITLTLGEITLQIPFLASAMDGVVDAQFAIAMGKLGGLAVLNLDGIQARYDDPQSVLARIAEAPASEITGLLQRSYAEPIKENLIGDRVREIKSGGVLAAVSATPTTALRLGPLAVEAGADIFVVQSTVTTARHVSSTYPMLSFTDLRKTLRVPLLVGNSVSYAAALELMDAGIDGLLVGVGPGAACTSRQVLGVGVPQVTATMDCAAAREHYFKSSGRYVAIITDGGMSTGGDISKSIASGADGVMLGSPFAQAKEAPGRGFHWGMATPHASLPRGTRIRVGTHGSLEQILLGPTSLTDGTQNLVGALRISMGMLGARNIKEMQQVEMVIAPAIRTEGKAYQMAQGLT